MISEKMILTVAKLERDSITQAITIQEIEQRLSIFEDQQIAKIIVKGKVKTLARLISLLCTYIADDQQKAIVLGYTSIEEMNADRQRMINDIKGKRS